MSRSDRREALERLTGARKALEEATPDQHDQLNQEVLDAEKQVPFGRVRGWGYTPGDEEN